MRFLLGVLATLVVLAAGGLGVVWSGAYDVAASDPHPDPVRWALETTLENSVERRAEGIVAPASFTPDQVEKGFASFDGMCAQCHGAPGVAADEWAEDMRPSPPSLSEAATQWTPEEVFWILQNGIKMSGMPALGPTHGEEEILGARRLRRAAAGDEPRGLRPAAGDARLRVGRRPSRCGGIGRHGVGWGRRRQRVGWGRRGQRVGWGGRGQLARTRGRGRRRRIRRRGGLASGRVSAADRRARAAQEAPGGPIDPPGAAPRAPSQGWTSTVTCDSRGSAESRAL